jgi:hypothetical protein
MIVDGGVILGGRRWEEGVAFRADLAAKIKQRING